MIKEFENCTDDYSDSGFGRYKGTSPSNVPGKDAGDDDNDVSGDGDDDEDPKEDLEEESNGDKTQEKGVVHKGWIELEN